MSSDAPDSSAVQRHRSGDQTPPRRRLGAGKLTLLFAGLMILTLLTLFMAWQRRNSQRIEQELARLRAAGEPMTPAEMEAFYRLPDDREDCTRLWMAACVHFDGPAFKAAAANLPIVGNSNSTNPPPPGQAWADLEAVEAFLQQYQPAMEQLHEAARRGGSARYHTDFNQGIGMLIPYVQQLRGVARMLLLEAVARAHRGDAHGAAQSLRTMWRLGESLENDPLLISQLVRVAIDDIATSQLESFLPCLDFSAEDLRGIQAELRRTNYGTALRRSLRAERAMGFHAIMHYDQTQADLGVQRVPLAGLMMRMEGAFYLEQMGRLVESGEGELHVARRNMQQVEAEIEQIQHRPAFQRIGTTMTSMLLPSLSAATDATCRAQARAATADAAIAAELFRRQHGRPPGSLAELVPEFLPAVPTDPFDGLPLRFVRRDGELLIYSIGANNADDGGTEQNHSGKPDAVFRLPVKSE